MGRPAGSHNPDFEATRARLLRGVFARLAEPDGARASFRDLAAAAGVSVATLRHYFGSREGLIQALFEQSHEAGRRYLLEVAAGPIGPVRESLAYVLDQVGAGFRAGVLDKLHAIGLSAGMMDPAIGPAYLRWILEPTIESLEARLSRHIARGELRAGDVRNMAILAHRSPARRAPPPGRPRRGRHPPPLVRGLLRRPPRRLPPRLRAPRRPRSDLRPAARGSVLHGSRSPGSRSGAGQSKAITPPGWRRRSRTGTARPRAASARRPRSPSAPG